MIKVEVGEHSLDDALRIFKKSVNESGVLWECLRRESFMNRHEKNQFYKRNKRKK